MPAVRFKAALNITGLTVAGLGLAACLIGCSHPAARGHLASGGSSGMVSATRPSNPATPASPSAATGADPQASLVPPGPPEAGPGSGPELPNGNYADGAGNVPHYILSLRLSQAAVRGSVAYLYQDGKTARITRYTGQLSGGQQLTLRFGDGSELSGSYRRGSFTLANCTTVMPWATHLAGCTFSLDSQAP